MRSLYHSIYLQGLDGSVPSRWLRRLIAKSELHRAWLAGYMHIFSDEHGHRISVCDRDWYRYRRVSQQKFSQAGH